MENLCENLQEEDICLNESIDIQTEELGIVLESSEVICPIIASSFLYPSSFYKCRFWQ